MLIAALGCRWEDRISGRHASKREAPAIPLSWPLWLSMSIGICKNALWTERDDHVLADHRHKTRRGPVRHPGYVRGGPLHG
jgi:hypothetical protein